MDRRNAGARVRCGTGRRALADQRSRRGTGARDLCPVCPQREPDGSLARSASTWLDGEAMDQPSGANARRATAEHVDAPAAGDECFVSRRYRAQRRGLSRRAATHCLSRALAGSQCEASTQPYQESLPPQAEHSTAGPASLCALWGLADGERYPSSRTATGVLRVPSRSEATTALPQQPVRASDLEQLLRERLDL